MEYPVLSLSAASIGLCEQGVTPFYDIVWSFDYYLENVTPETEFGFLFFLQNDLVNPIVGGTPGPGLGYTQGLVYVRYDRPNSVSTFYAPSGMVTYNTISRTGLGGGLLGVGFDSTGCYALSVGYGDNLLRDGKADSERIPNSVAIRGGAPHFSYDKYSVNYALTNFNIVDTVKKTVRARLGNLGRTIYIDYRYRPDQHFIPLLAHDVDLGVSLYNFLRPGITITKNISSSRTASAPIVIVENFHFEGKTEIPILDSGTNLPQLSVLTLGPVLTATPPVEPPLIIGAPPTIPVINNLCAFRTIKTVYYNGDIAPFTSIEIDGTLAGISDSTGVLSCNVCDGYRVINGYKDKLRGTVDIFVEDETNSVTLILSPADNPVPNIPSGPFVTPTQLNKCSVSTSVVSAYVTNYDANGNVTTNDLYNYGYAVSASGVNSILYRVEPFKYTNNSKTLTLSMEKLNENWTLTDTLLNRFIGQLAHPIGTFTCGLSTINLSYYNV